MLQSYYIKNNIDSRTLLKLYDKMSNILIIFSILDMQCNVFNIKCLSIYKNKSSIIIYIAKFTPFTSKQIVLSLDLIVRRYGTYIHTYMHKYV